MDNQTVVKYGPIRPHSKAANMNLRLPLSNIHRQRPLQLRWIPSQRTVQRYHTTQNREDIKYNNQADQLAKAAAMLPPPDTPQTTLADITICGVIAPTPCKKWILHHRITRMFHGAHWVPCFPMKGSTRIIRTTWLWKNFRLREKCGFLN